MNITVGAALKKLAAAKLLDKNTLQKAGMAVLVVVVALLLPMIAIITVFTGILQLDTSQLMAQIQENMTDEQRGRLQAIEDTMNAISTALITAEMPGRVKEAQVLYILALYDHSSQPGFVSRLVSCFQPEQSDGQLISAVNAAFGTNIQTEDFTRLVGKCPDPICGHHPVR